MYLRTLFNWLVPATNALEDKILTAIEAQLTPSMAERFSKQRAKINYVQRREGGSDVGLYSIRGGRVSRGPSLRIPVFARECRLARVILRIHEAVFKATVYLVDGQLSSIEYETVPPTGSIDIVVESVQVFDLPSRKPAISDRHATLPDWVHQFSQRFEVGPISPPVLLEDRENQVKEFEARFPDDYMELVSKCDGVDIGSVSIAGITEIYDTTTKDGQFVVLGQIGGIGAIAVRKPGPHLVFLDYEDATATELGDSLRVALELLREKIVLAR